MDLPRHPRSSILPERSPPRRGFPTFWQKPYFLGAATTATSLPVAFRARHYLYSTPGRICAIRQRWYLGSSQQHFIHSQQPACEREHTPRYAGTRWYAHAYFCFRLPPLPRGWRETRWTDQASFGMKAFLSCSLLPLSVQGKEWR